MENMAEKESLFQAEAVWHLASPNGNEACPFELTNHNDVVFETLEGQEYEDSVARGGDGRVGWFRGGCLSLHTYRARRLRPKNNAVSLYVRAFLHPEEDGTLFFSDFLGLSLHPNGLVLAFIGVKIPTGNVYREMPLCYLHAKGWTDLVLTVGQKELRFYVNGEMRSVLPVPQDLCAPFDDDLVIGAFRCSKPDTYDTGIPSGHLRDARLDTVALWHRVLKAKQIAYLSGVDEITNGMNGDVREQLFRLKNAFFDASTRKDVAACEQISEQLYAIARQDTSRPVYHLTQPLGYIFDPCGAYYYGGRYHVFSYHNVQHLLTYSSLDHYVSEDLVHWTQWPIAPFADSDCDVFCIYLLNHFIDEQGDLRALYTGQGVNGKCGILARSEDGMVSYTDKRAVLTKYHHDGHVFKHAGRWYTITSKLCRGSRSGDRGDPVMLWSSEDLENWTEEGEIFTQRKWEGNPDGFMEFPYLLSFGEKDVLILGGHPVYYWVGHMDWDEKVFIPDKDERILLDLTNPFHCYNPLCVDDKGPNGTERRLLMALYQDISVADPQAPSKWYCTHVQPRVLSLDADHLRQDPLPELAARRGAFWTEKELLLEPKKPVATGLRSNCAEIYVQFAPDQKGLAGVKWDLPDGREVRAWYDGKIGQVGIDGAVRNPGHGSAYPVAGQPVELRVFLDRQLVEVFVNGQSCTTVTMVPMADDTELSLFCDNGVTSCLEYTVWDMTDSGQ